VVIRPTLTPLRSVSALMTTVVPWARKSTVLRIDAALLQHVEHALLEIRRGRVGLGGDNARLARLVVGLEADEVGEGAADVGCDADGLFAITGLR
jgi:hypothetical protein